MFGYPGLDAGQNTSRDIAFRGDIAIPIDEACKIFSRLVYATSNQGIKPLDKASFQFYNLFRTMKTCAMNAKSSIIQKFPKSIAIRLEV